MAPTRRLQLMELKKKKNAVRSARMLGDDSAPTDQPSPLYRFKILLFWVVVVLAHTTSAAYLLVFAAFHLVLSSQAYFMRQFAVETNMVVVAFVYVLSSLLHIRRVGIMVHASCRHRAFRFEYEPQAPVEHAKLMRKPSLFQAGVALWKKYLARRGVFGIFGEHGDIRIWCVECLNLAAHVVQASRWSVIARPTTTFAISVLFSCECLYPAIYHSFHTRISRSMRVRLLLMDIVVDTLLCALIPSLLVMPFTIQYLTDPHVVNSNYSEMWYAEGVLTFKRSLATTPLDLITKLSPFYFNYMSLVEISSRVPMSTQSARVLETLTATEMSQQRFSSIRVQPASILQPAAFLLELDWRRLRTLRLKRVWFWIMRLGFGTAAVFFMLMALLSSEAIESNLVACRPNCLYSTIPWFTKGCACIVQELNCAKLNISGSDGVHAKITDYSDDAYISVLILNDCNSLVIPKAIRNLPNLMGIYVYSSELVEWGEDAALTSDAFALISYIVFVNTTLTEIPAGLLTNLASTVQDIEIVGSPVTFELPDNLHEKWPHVATLYLERCSLVEFPEPLLQMENLRQLSLAGNALTELPEALFASPLLNSLEYLALSANPSLTHLPPHLEAPASLQELYVDATSVAALDVAGVAASSDLRVSAAESPLCGSGSTSPRVSCSGLYGGMYTLGVYPLLAEQRATRSAKFLPANL